MKTNHRFAARAIALAGVLLVSAAAQAQSKAPGGLYGEIGLTQVTYKESGYSFKPTVLRGIIGAEVHTNLAIEGMAGFGIANSSANVSGVRVYADIDNMWGVYLKPKASVTPDLDIFARIGYAKTNAAFSALGYRITGSGVDMSYGLGASYKITDKIAANFDYMSYYNKDGGRGTGITAGLGFKF